MLVSTRDHPYFEQIPLVYDILHTANSFRGLDLHGVGGVRVGAQGEAGIGMAQHAGDGADDSATAFTVHAFQHLLCTK